MHHAMTLQEHASFNVEIADRYNSLKMCWSVVTSVVYISIDDLAINSANRRKRHISRSSNDWLQANSEMRHLQ